MSRTSLAVVALLVFAAVVSSWPAGAQGGASRVTVFEGARLIAGDGAAPIENSAFVVQNDRFTRVGRRSDIQVPAGAVRIDLTGKTVMPAKVDTHGHLGYENVVDGTTSKSNFTRDNLIDHLERFAYMGFSAVVSIADLAEREIMPGDHLNVFQSPRDPAMPTSGRFAWGDVPLRVRNEVIPHAALFRTAGPGISWPGAGAGGHPSRNDVMYPVTTVEEARRAVQDYVKTKPAFVKIWVDDRGGTLTTLTPELYRAIIQEATRLNVPVVAHTVKLADAKELYHSGARGRSARRGVAGDRPGAGREEHSPDLVQRAGQPDRAGPAGVGRSAAMGDAFSRTGAGATG